MNIEKFNQGNSVLHRRDGRVKLVGFLGLSLAIALSQNFPAVWVGLFFGLAAVFAARINLKTLGSRLLLVNSFTLLLWLALPFTYPGEIWCTLGPFSLSLPGILLAALITLKTNAIVFLCIALLATSSMADLGTCLEKLGLPRKLCLILLFSYRYIFVIFDEFMRLRRAAGIRGFRTSISMHTYRTYGYLFGMTLVKSWQRAEKVQAAMELRGFHGRFYSLNEISLSTGDHICGFFLLTTASMVMGVNYFF